ncbi:hypothetical protein ACFYZ5_46610 [Streptomyces chartreusis]|uniref:hypothetical protein n=1 Tax=Streptomyces chartreusis TaxID=1969 RepID=UPI0036AF72CA
MINLEQAAELAQKYVDGDPLNSEVDLIPIDGYVAVVGEAAYFGFQNRQYLAQDKVADQVCKRVDRALTKARESVSTTAS